MSYTQAQMAAAVSALTLAIRGLHPDVALAWASAEQGVRYNILGVTYVDATGQHPFRYGSWAEGAQAAARLIATGPYGGIRASLASGSSAAQAAAIVASPWNHPYYSRGAGAWMLRRVASSGAAPAGPTRVVIHGPTPVRDALGRVLGEVTLATYRVGAARLVGAAWQYPLLDRPGWWVRPTRFAQFS